MLNMKRIFELGIKIEEMGYLFYQKASELERMEYLKPLFNRLAKDELNHKKTFEAMILKLKVENLASLNLTDTFIKNLEADIFDINKIEETLKSFKNASDLINFGISREEATIKYFSDIKPYLENKNKNVIETIINEEKAHLKDLLEIRKKYTKLLEDKKTLNKTNKPF